LHKFVIIHLKYKHNLSSEITWLSCYLYSVESAVPLGQTGLQILTTAL